MSEENKIPPEEIPQKQPVNKELVDETVSSAEINGIIRRKIL